ncbi:outer membrane protein [Mangrovicoccus algicola]|uniref:Outer membrane beta-barrel protein n=1 Tax=Mangrovicoccus algicola TaxID=2771008 RepID=A0A8J6YV91_9RHOB|nr:outer membrane beta-barrel protein [Mangrovicoccus algicola]MBE3636698.1 outer membrane beta-barrel protein [Mangrovicoccus algicola]
MRAVYALATASALGLAATPIFAGALEEPVITPAPAPVAAAPIGSLWDGFYAGGQFGGAWLDADGDAANGDSDDWLGGAHIGWQGVSANGLVYGVEGDMNGTALELDGHDVNSLSHLKAKLGYDMGRSMIYATGGAAYTDIKGLSESWGWTGGVGYDYMVTDDLSVGAEVQYQAFDDFDGGDTDVDGTSAVVKVSYHF